MPLLTSAPRFYFFLSLLSDGFNNVMWNTVVYILEQSMKELVDTG